MSTGLKVAYLWHDNDVIEVRVTVENARFRGTANVYVGTDGLLEAAGTLAGFPKHSRDKREVIFGAVCFREVPRSLFPSNDHPVHNSAESTLRQRMFECDTVLRCYSYQPVCKFE